MSVYSFGTFLDDICRLRRKVRFGRLYRRRFGLRSVYFCQGGVEPTDSFVLSFCDVALVPNGDILAFASDMLCVYVIWLIARSAKHIVARARISHRFYLSD